MQRFLIGPRPRDCGSNPSQRLRRASACLCRRLAKYFYEFQLYPFRSTLRCNICGTKTIETGARILILDDDGAIRDSLRVLLESAGYLVSSYAVARLLLSDGVEQCACLIADIRMPEMGGLEVQTELVRRGLDIPVIIMTAFGDVPLAVQAMKAGAVDFIEKPFEDETIMASISRALEISAGRLSRKAEINRARQQFALLTVREREVLEQIAEGRSNKIAAYHLEISPRTLEIHRAHIMHKTGSRGVADLVRIFLASASPPESRN